MAVEVSFRDKHLLDDAGAGALKGTPAVDGAIPGDYLREILRKFETNFRCPKSSH